MSGLEVAGVVLGAIPVVLAALEIGGNAYGRVKGWSGYKVIIKRYQIVLEAQHAIFQNTLLLLLEDVLPPLEIEILLKDPAGSAWEDPRLKAKLRDERLGEDFDKVLNIIGLMKLTLQDFKKKLGGDEIQNQHRATIIARIIASRARLDELLKDLAHHNAILQTLTSQATSLQPSRRAGKFIAPLDRFKARAVSLYKSVQAAVTCNCQWHDGGIVVDYAHVPDEKALTFMFGFEDRAPECRGQFWIPVTAKYEGGLTVQASNGSISTKTPNLNGRHIVSNFKAAKAAMSRSQTAGASSNHPATLLRTTSLITNLCDQLYPSRLAAINHKFGKIVHRELEFDLTQSPLLSETGSANVVSFSEWLLAPRRPSLAIIEKMPLATSLATAGLALSQTPWLAGDLSPEHVLILDLKPAKIAMLAHFKPDIEMARTWRSTKFVRDPTLFCLGILLIELAFEKPILQLCDLANCELDWTRPQSKQIAELAKALIDGDHVLDQCGLNYDDAVRTCFQTEWTFQKTTLGIQDEAYRRSRYEAIIIPLAANISASSS